jgi:hypothetical protein
LPLIQAGMKSWSNSTACRGLQAQPERISETASPKSKNPACDVARHGIAFSLQSSTGFHPNAVVEFQQFNSSQCNSNQRERLCGVVV